MAKYILSFEAQNSLREIREYSIKNFGIKRAKKYLQDLASRMELLAENPMYGIVRRDLKVGFYSNFIGSHTIYYRLRTAHIDIIDVLHQSMDPTNHLTN